MSTQPPEFRLLTESRMGVAGGVAGLDDDGDVVDAAGQKVVSSGSTIHWNTIPGKPTWVGAGDSAAEARAAIGAGTSNLALGSSSSTAKRGNWTPTADEIPNIPIDRVTGLPDELSSKADTTDLPTWDTLPGRPAIVAAGSTAATARASIGAGTSSLTLGTSSAQAKPGNWLPSASEIPPIPISRVEGLEDALETGTGLPSGGQLTVHATGGTWPARPTDRTDVTVYWIDFSGTLGAPPEAIADHDIVLRDVSA